MASAPQPPPAPAPSLFKSLKDELASINAQKKGTFEQAASFNERIKAEATAARSRWGGRASSSLDPVDEAFFRKELRRELKEFEPFRASFGEAKYGDPFAPCKGPGGTLVPENRARYIFWPAQSTRLPLLFTIASCVLGGGMGPATAVLNESLQAIAKFVSCAQRASAGADYVNDAALARATLPTMIAALPSLAELQRQADNDGFLDDSDAADLVEELLH